MGLIGRLQRLFQRPRALQVAMLCTRRGPEGLEILLVKTLDTGRWLLPKGWPEDGMTLCEAAVREAWEEAGATGRVHPDEIGRYGSYKRRWGGVEIPTDTVVFRMDDTVLAERYPEAGLRERRFLSRAAAADCADVEELAVLIRAVRP